MSASPPPARVVIVPMRPSVDGLRTRVVASVLLPVASLTLVILYLAFYAHNFAWYQDLAVFLVTVIVVTGAIILMWILWAMKAGRRMMEVEGRWE